MASIKENSNFPQTPLDVQYNLEVSGRVGNQSRTNCVQYLFNTQTYTHLYPLFSASGIHVFLFQPFFQSNSFLLILVLLSFPLEKVLPCNKQSSFLSFVNHIHGKLFYFSSDCHEHTICCYTSPSLNVTEENECLASSDA